MKKNKIFVRIEGGLGNQLFQYAAGRSLADRLNFDLILDLSGLNIKNDRLFQLNLYNIRASVATDRQLALLPNSKPSRWRRIKYHLALLAPKLFSISIFWPKSFAFDKRINNVTKSVYMIGYWQSEKYFDWNRRNVLQDIQLHAPLPENMPWLFEIKNSCSVALHIRRGDYFSNSSAAEFHGLCDLTYYYKAVEILRLRLPSLRIFVFSDEPEWAKIHLKLDVPTYFVESNSVDSGHYDLELMRRCKHHIIANSSFSWWGAWLCVSPGQLVCAPDRWFASTTVDTQDVLPAHWLKIS